MARTCDTATNNANAETCKRTRPDYLYAPVPVMITASDSTKRAIAFQARDVNGNYVEVKDVSWDGMELWVECPSTLEGDSKTLPKTQSSGVLYLSEGLLTKFKLAGRPKWPNALAAEPTAFARIWPTKITFEGIEVESGSMTAGSVDLLDPALCGTAHDAKPQVLVLDGAAPTLELTQAGLKKFLLPFPTTVMLERAVETIKARRDPAKIIDAWKIVSRWDAAIARGEKPEPGSAALVASVLDASPRAAEAPGVAKRGKPRAKLVANKTSVSRKPARPSK